MRGMAWERLRQYREPPSVYQFPVRHGPARRVAACQGGPWHGPACQGMVRRGKGEGAVRWPSVWFIHFRHGAAVQGAAWHGTAWLGEARPGLAWARVRFIRDPPFVRVIPY